MWAYVLSALLTFLSIATAILTVILYHVGQLRFSNPEWLPALILVPLVILLVFFRRRRLRRLREGLGREEVTRKLLPPSGGGLHLFSETALVVAVFLSLLALLGPRMGTKMETLHRRGVDILLAVDVSKSMDADDIKPTRLKRAALQIEDFLDVTQGDRLGLVAFAGDAFVQCPLTLDYSAVKIFLDVLNTSLIPTQGTDIGRAIEVALSAFNEKEHKHKVLILFTDGEDHGGQAEKMAKKAADDGVVIYTIGIGSPGGSVIPVTDGQGHVTGYKKDEEGKVVTSHLDETILQKIALDTGGKYYRSTTGEMELKRIYREISRMEKKGLGSMELTRFKERYQLFLLPALLLFLLSALAVLPWRQS